MKIAHPKKKARELGLTNNRSPRIDEQTAEQIATLVSKGLNETEAALLIGIKPEAFFVWKSRNKDKYGNTLTRIRAAKINHCIEAIDQAGDGKTIETATGETIVLSRADWRAKAWLLERAVAPDRFSQKEQIATNAPAIALDVLSSLASLVYGQGKPAQDVEVITRPELPEKAGNG